MSRQSDTLLRRGFTLIELLVVIAIIGLLIAAMAIVGGKVMHHQRVNLTETIMRGTTMAIDQFSEENPLRSIYDRKGRRTFGSMVPYQLEMDAIPFEGYPRMLEPDPPTGLQQRLIRDLLPPGPIPAQAIVLDPRPGKDRDNDMRALYTYLAVFTPGALDQVSQAAIRPLSEDYTEFVNTDTTGPQDFTRTPILGIHDAWGVPLDYFLYTKLEYKIRQDNTTGFEVTDRIPVLRSKGVSKEEFLAGLEPGGTPLHSERTWIFSQPFPSPPAQQGAESFCTSGNVTAWSDSSGNGWARAVADGDFNPGAPDESFFGFIPYREEP